MLYQTFQSKAIEVFNSIDSRSMFIVLHNYKNNFGEMATHSLLWHIDYPKAVQKSFNIITSFIPTLSFCVGKMYTLSDLKIAHQELVDSFADTLVLGAGKNPRYTCSDVYDQVADKNGILVPGIKLHRKQDILHMTNVYRLKKIVHVPGKYPNINHLRKTLAKNDLRALLPLKKFGQFVLYPGRFQKLSVQKIGVVEEDVIRKENGK